MNWVENDVVALLYHLLPGFFTAWIFHGLTAHVKPSPFERVVQALIFTAIIQVPVLGIRAVGLIIGRCVALGVWSQEVGFIWSMIVAALLGHALAHCANNDLYHRFVRGDGKWRFARFAKFLARLGITKRTSYPCEWFSGLSTEQRFVLLHLKDGRRLFGWPYEWPDHPDTGHFVMMRPEWVLDNAERAALFNVERMLIPATEVAFVDILKFESEVEATDTEREVVEKRLIALQEDGKDTQPNGDNTNGNESASTTTTE